MTGSAWPGSASPGSVTAASPKQALANALVRACADAGTTHMFGVPGGGSNLDVVDAAEANDLRFVLTHGETAAAVMAAVMGELTGAPGLCVATRGPGAASAVNGVAQALLDRQPMVLVTDCVARTDRARVSHQRLDQQQLFAAVSLASVVLDGRDDDAPARAVRLTQQGRPGPVHVDIDPSAPTFPAHSVTASTRPVVAAPLSLDDSPTALTLLRGARRPVVVVGLGAIAQVPAARQRIVDALDELGRRTHVPMLCTYKARGVVPDDAPWCAGVATGATIESPVLDGADLVLGVGLDPVELIPASWPYRAPVVLLGSWPVDDSDYLDAGTVVEVCGDLPALVTAASQAVAGAWPVGSGQAFRRAAMLALASAARSAADGLTPQQVVTIASDAAPDGCLATVDAGAHMLVTMPLWHAGAPCQLLISSGLATMGFALPAAVAAALARPGAPVVCFTGDGGLGMVLAELETLSRLDLPVVVVVFNDASLSLIAAKQAPAGHGGRGAVTYRRTDFAAVAEASGVRGHCITDVETYRRALAAALTSGHPTLLDVRVDPSGYPDVLDVIRAPR